MRKTLVILGFITAILSVIFVVTPLFKLSIFPSVIAVICGLGIWYFAKKQGQSKKVVQYIFLLTIISLGMLTYKSVVETSKVGDTEALEQLEKTSEDEAIEELEDLDLEIE